MKNSKNIISIVLSVLVIVNIIVVGFSAKANDYFAQYSGDANRNWGYIPHCTFTIDKIVDSELTGSFSIGGIGAYGVSNYPVNTKVYFNGN